MNDDEAFITAIAALHGASETDDVCAPFLTVLPVTGVGITTLGDPFGSEIVSASDPSAERFEELQIDLGEGPSWEAMRTGRPVLVPDVQTTTSEVWPVASMAMREADLAAVFAFPMRIGALPVGSVDLYGQHAGALPGHLVQDAAALTDAITRQVLRRALTRADADAEEEHHDVNVHSRREVYQASGVLAAQIGVGADDALLLLRAYAFADGLSVRALANEVLARTVDFTDRNDSAR
ncbi:GAF and ANTAR domain-containing protein (plasmid) [Curtobacterium sp. YC1]|uniref:GAF and ANTAR domain-containing protein n=1 Tax=Curtobacterium sp. YC1 TaxID=2795488 RepID=UPI0018E4DF5D|nr:GAF and ANTAR domain-containing protein [Curtobacterium sp. YC1]QQD77900.1 GAF and ANTAR domain-containing protein [Curtobacterium sp. YC1]